MSNDAREHADGFKQESKDLTIHHSMKQNDQRAKGTWTEEWFGGKVNLGSKSWSSEHTDWGRRSGHDDGERNGLRRWQRWGNEGDYAKSDQASHTGD